MTDTTLDLHRISTTVRDNFLLLAARLGLRGLALVSPDAAAGRAMRLFAAPRVSPVRPARAGTEAAQRRVWIEVAGMPVAAYVWGDPAAQRAVLLSHGWSASADAMKAFVHPLRAAGYAVVALDHVAHGASGGRLATLPRFAQALSAAAAHFGPFHAVIGHSLGAAAVALALRDGLAATRVVLIAPPADMLRVTRRFARRLWLAPEVVARMLGRFERSEGVPVDALRVDALVRDLQPPALVIHDLADTQVAWADGERYARLWPGARLLATDGLGHNRILRDAHTIAAVVRYIGGADVGVRAVGSDAWW